MRNVIGQYYYSISTNIGGKKECRTACANYRVYRSSIIEEPISTDRSVDATERRWSTGTGIICEVTSIGRPRRTADAGGSEIVFVVLA